MTQSCVVCGSCTDAFLCGDDRAGTGCLGRLMQHLGDSAWLVDQLNTTLARLDKVGGASVGFVSNGGDEQPLPLNLQASDAGMSLRDKLCSWSADLWERNAARHADGSVPQVDLEPRIVPVSRWLMRHPTWIKLHPAADELFHELMGAFSHAHRAIDIPQDSRQFLGKCGFEMNDEVCTEELFSSPRTTEVTCGVCGSEWVVEERRDWLLKIAEDEVGTAEVLSALLFGLGVQVQATQIQTLAKQGRLTAVAIDAHRKRTYRVGDVLTAFMGEQRLAS